MGNASNKLVTSSSYHLLKPQIKKLYHLSFDQLPTLENQMMKLKSRSDAMQRAIIAAMASAIGLCDIGAVAVKMNLISIDHEGMARNLQARNGTEIAECKKDAKSMARNLQGENGTELAGRDCEGAGGGINKPLSNLFEGLSHSNSSKKKIPYPETYEAFGRRVVEMLEFWNKIELGDEEWTESYKSYVLKNKECRSDLARLLKDL